MYKISTALNFTGFFEQCPISYIYFKSVLMDLLYGFAVMVLRLLRIRLPRWSIIPIAILWFTIGSCGTTLLLIDPIRKLQEQVAIPYVEQAALKQCKMEIDASKGTFQTDLYMYPYYTYEYFYFEGTEWVGDPICKYFDHLDKWTCDCGR